jgi:hypothetical protein
LKAISIEGISQNEGRTRPVENRGEEIVDVAAYYGSEDITQATEIEYVQLKHSTVQTEKAWTFSDLKGTLKGFSNRFGQLKAALGGIQDGFASFIFISNRPVSPRLVECIDDIRGGSTNRYPGEKAKLQRCTGLKGQDLRFFCSHLQVLRLHEGYLEQRASLAVESQRYLAARDIDVSIRLKELVTRKATSEFAAIRTITRTDVLHALEATEDDLFPVPSLLTGYEDSIPRLQEQSLLDAILKAEAPILIHAAGGVGKSVIAQRLAAILPSGSEAVLYDCFGNGEYRKPGSPRHRHKEGIVQIANEMASLGLCDPLIPHAHADRADYLRAFHVRLEQCNNELARRDSSSMLCIVIDAADNAEMIAREQEYGSSFVRDLLQETCPAQIRIIALCRTERQMLLEPGDNVTDIELQPFERSETAQFLKSHFPLASEGDIDEFHRLTSQNPRVQASALAEGGDLPDILLRLGPGPTTVDETIYRLLESAVSKLRNRVSGIEREQIETIARGLACLRPFVPIHVLAQTSGVEEAAVRSFVADLGRPLLIVADAVQFRDEPTETWFRQNYKPAPDQLSSFIQRLTPLAEHSSYAAAALPELLLEAGLLADLIRLALSADALPVDSPIERREIETNRLQFALRASLRAKRFLDAANLALKAGQEMAGNSRQEALLQSNIDILPLFLEPHRLQELAASHRFSSKWPGARHAFEAALLADIHEFHGDARSRLRMAHEWFRTWVRLPDAEREKISIDINDIVALALTKWRLDGPSACGNFMRTWRPRIVSFQAGLTLAKQALDRAQYEEVDALTSCPRSDIYLVLGIALELWKIGRFVPSITVKRMLRILRNRRITIEPGGHSYSDEMTLGGITAIIEAAIALDAAPREQLVDILSKFLKEPPPYDIKSQHGSHRATLLRAYVLYFGLQGKEVQLEHLAPDDLRKEIEKNTPHSESQTLREFREDLTALLPWQKLRVQLMLSELPDSELAKAISDAREKSKNYPQHSSRTRQFTIDEIAELWYGVLASRKNRSLEGIAEFHTWASKLRFPLFIPTWMHLSRLAARTLGLQSDSYRFASKAAELHEGEKDDAQSKAQTYVELARAMIGFDLAEAREYFRLAMEVAGKIGDELRDRWLALLDLADKATESPRDVPEVAYRLARCGEIAAEYNRDYFEAEGTVKAIVGLSAKSSVAILSRWRDRRFDRIGRLLKTGLSALLKNGRVNPRLVTALLWFDVEWDTREIISDLLKYSDSDDATVTFKRAIAPFRFRHHSPSVWRDFQSLVTEYGIAEVDLAPELSFSVAEEQRATVSESGSSSANQAAPSKRGNKQHSWNDIFGGSSIESEQVVWSAFQQFREMEPPRYHEQFFSEVCARTAPGREAALLRAICESDTLDSYEIRKFLEQIPTDWKRRLAVQTALKDCARTLSSRFATEITRSRYLGSLPLALLSELSSVPERELLEVIFRAVGGATEPFESSQLYSLVGFLSPLLSTDEALEGLDFGLSLFEVTLAVEDGDGAWSPALVPSGSMDQVIAGLIYTALADPSAGIRWQAAHVVVELCALGCSDALTALVSFAEQGIAGPFGDAHFHFYDLHARQWLLIGLARAAMQYPLAVSAYREFLKTQAVSEMHVVIRHFAARALIALADQGIPIDQQTLDVCANGNRSALPKVVSERYRRHDGSSAPADRWNRPDKFHFSYDMDRYWFEPLGRVFGVPSFRIEDLAESVIQDEWKIQNDGLWQNDRREQSGVFREQETWHSHSSYPQADNLSFYLSYHSMMLVAGRMLATTSVHQDPDSERDEFEEWLDGHLLSRRDGYWRADRRDSVPLEGPNWDRSLSRDDWKWAVAKGDFDQFLGTSSERINVWGRWTIAESSQEQSIDIDSALICRDRSDAFLRAAQTAAPQDVAIPAWNGDSEIDSGSFQLKGWIREATAEENLEMFDPWAGDIHIPAPEPAQHVVEALGLVTDVERRVWTRVLKDTRSDVCWSQVWGGPKGDEQEARGNRGRRLQVDRAFLNRVLHTVGMDLIFKVQIERRIQRMRYESSRGDYDGYIPPSYRYYILSEDGGFRSI